MKHSLPSSGLIRVELNGRHHGGLAIHATQAPGGLLSLPQQPRNRNNEKVMVCSLHKALSAIEGILSGCF